MKIFFFLIFFFFFQCIPDPKRSLVLPPPYNVEVSTNGNDIFLKVEGNYDKDTFSSFIGYNIYVGFFDNNSEILKRIIYFDNFLPSISAGPGEGNKEKTIKKIIRYQNLFEDRENNVKKNSFQEQNISTFSNYYFIVKPIDNAKKEGNNNQQLLYVKPFRKKNNLTFDITTGNLTIEEKFEIEFNIAQKTITPLNQSGIISYGYRNNVLEIKTIPQGESREYSENKKLFLKKNYLYALNNGVHYLKLYILDITGNIITYDYCYQQQEGIFK